MITSAANRGWPGDVAIIDYKAAGLPSVSVIRTEKIAMLDSSAIVRQRHNQRRTKLSYRPIRIWKRHPNDVPDLKLPLDQSGWRHNLA